MSGSSITSGSFTVQNGLLQLQQDNALVTNNRDVTVQMQNTGGTVTSDVQFDLNGADAQIEDLVLGAAATNLSSGTSTVSVVNSDFATNGGTLSIDGNVFYRDGTRIELAFTGENAGGTRDLANNREVTGAISGATGFIEGIQRSGTSGVLSIRNLSGIPFQAGETIETIGFGSGGGTGDGTATASGPATDVGTTKLNKGAEVSANLQIVNSNTNFFIDDGIDPVDLLISGDISADTTGRNITVNGEGTLQLDGTNTHNRTILQNQMTILGSGDAFGIGDTAGAGVGNTGTNAAANQEGRVFLRQLNSVRFPTNGDELYVGAVTLDINGQDAVFAENFEIGGGTGNLAPADVTNINVIDSVGTGKLVFSGLNGQFDTNNIVYQAGTAGQQNKKATISADVEIVTSGMTVAVNNGADDVDLEISGNFLSDIGGGRQVSKSGQGTLLLSGMNTAGDGGGAIPGGIDILAINTGTVQITSDANLGDNDVQLGNNTTDGTLEYLGAGETINNQFRIGDNNSTVGTRVGDGSLLNNGTGTLTISQGTFNQARTSAMTNRTVTFGGPATSSFPAISSTTRPVPTLVSRRSTPIPSRLTAQRIPTPVPRTSTQGSLT